MHYLHMSGACIIKNNSIPCAELKGRLGRLQLLWRLFSGVQPGAVSSLELSWRHSACLPPPATYPPPPPTPPPPTPANKLNSKTDTLSPCPDLFLWSLWKSEYQSLLFCFSANLRTDTSLLMGQTLCQVLCKLFTYKFHLILTVDLPTYLNFIIVDTDILVPRTVDGLLYSSF